MLFNGSSSGSLNCIFFSGACGPSISYRDLDEMSLALAAYLQSKGLQKGARVALMMPNVLQYPVSTAAVLRARAMRSSTSIRSYHPTRA